MIALMLLSKMAMPKETEDISNMWHPLPFFKSCLRILFHTSYFKTYPIIHCHNLMTSTLALESSLATPGSVRCRPSYVCCCPMNRTRTYSLSMIFLNWIRIFGWLGSVRAWYAISFGSTVVIFNGEFEKAGWWRFDFDECCSFWWIVAWVLCFFGCWIYAGMAMTEYFSIHDGCSFSHIL